MWLFEAVEAYKPSEQATAEGTLVFRSLLENMQEGLILADKDALLHYVNPVMCEILGYAQHELWGRKFTDFLDTQSRNVFIEMEGRRSEGTAERYELSLTTKDGSIVHTLVSGQALFNRKGNFCGTFGIFTDITTRRKAEEALIAANQKLLDIIDFLPDATFVIDTEGKVIAWNRAMEEMTGMKAQDLLSKGNDHYSPPFYGVRRPLLIDQVFEPSGEVERAYRYVKREGGLLMGEVDLPNVNGKRLCLWGKAGPLYDSSGRVAGVIESIRDMTERRLVEEALVQAEEKYRGIFENSTEGIFQSSVEGRFLNANPALARMLGYASPEDLMNTVTDIGSELHVDPERQTELLRILEEQGRVQGFEVRFLKKDGGIAWVTLNVRAVHDKHGHLRFLEGTVHDLSERKALESKLIQAQKMEAIGTLAGGIAHDFNNILAAVIGYTEMAKAATEQPNVRRYLGQVLTACERARNLVGQILTFSRVTEQGKSPVEIAVLVKETLKLLRATLPSTIAFRFKTEPGVFRVLADPTQMHQVLINLCTNAAHAMRENGGLLEVGLVNFTLTPNMIPPDASLSPGHYVKLAIRDTGTGMAPDVIHRIFDPFFTTKKTGEGTGLGLSVVYGIVKGCGGAVTAESDLGVGSVFCVYLPAAASVDEARAEVFTPPPGGNEHVLFVDDEEILVDMWQHLLESLGYRATVKSDSRAAVELFRNQPEAFDLVITDLTMPGMTGIDLSKEILKVRPDIPIILCTGFNELITEKEARAMGIQGFAFKPLRVKTIAELIRTALEKREG